MAYPPFSVDMAALCGPSYTDTSANESDLVSQSEELHLNVSVLYRTKHTSINILKFFFISVLTPLNTMFVRERVKEKY